jgi:hypothetical protein
VEKIYVFWDDVSIACMDCADPQWLMELLGEHLEEIFHLIVDNGLHPVLRQQEV